VLNVGSGVVVGVVVAAAVVVVVLGVVVVKTASEKMNSSNERNTQTFAIFVRLFTFATVADVPTNNRHSGHFIFRCAPAASDLTQLNSTRGYGRRH